MWDSLRANIRVAIGAKKDLALAPILEATDGAGAPIHAVATAEPSFAQLAGVVA